MHSVSNISLLRFGLLIGAANHTTIQRCYANGNVYISASYSSGMLVGNGSPVFIEETFVDWNYLTVWSINEDVNRGYPYLSV